MDDRSVVVRTTLTAAKERCTALQRECDRHKGQKYPSPAAKVLLELISNTANVIEESIDQLIRDEAFRELLTPEQFLLKIHKHSEFVPYLHILLSFLRGAQIHETPSGLVPSMRRFVRKCLRDSEVLFACQPGFNYSFEEIAADIRQVYNGTRNEDFKEIIKDFPEYFIVIRFPSAELANVLLHCILAHEIGHGIYVRKELAAQLLPHVKINQDSVRSLSEAFLRGMSGRRLHGDEQLELFPSEVQLRQALTSNINDTVANWLSELTSDAFGLVLFGPAFFFAHAEFLISVMRLDRASRTHPPPRLRLRLLAKMMTNEKLEDSVGYPVYFNRELKTHYGDWKSEVANAIKCSDAILSIVIKAFEPVLEEIAGAAGNACEEELRYKSEQFKEVDELCNYIVNLIPPVERINPTTHSRDATDIRSILNAGWAVALTRLDEFASNIDLDPKKKRIECKEALGEMILKSAELLEIKCRWEEVRSASTTR